MKVKALKKFLNGLPDEAEVGIEDLGSDQCKTSEILHATYDVRQRPQIVLAFHDYWRK